MLSQQLHRNSACLQLLSLQEFIQAAAEANIIAGVQVKLLNEFALEYCNDSCQASAQGAVPKQQQRQPDAETAAAVDNTLPPPPLEQTVPSTNLPEAPQLQIQPLNLSAGLGAATNTGQQEATCFGLAAPALAPVSDPAAEGLSHHAAALMAFSGSMAGSYEAASAAAAAAALLQQAPYASSGQQQLAEPCPTSAGLLGPSHELLQALGYAADATAAAAAVTAAATAAAAAGPTSSAADAAAACKTSGSRKQRFTREQHAAILESVERNYAQYPSRYTELVIKEMQTLFPGIELNNACVRKIKFRANEAIKQLTPQQQQQQQDYAAALPDYQAADAAHGLVGLASAAAAAAAAGAYTDYAGMPEFSPEPAAAAAVTEQPVAGAVKTEADPAAAADSGFAQQEGGRAASPSTAAEAAVDTLQAHPADTPETAGVSTEPEGAALLAVAAAAGGQQQEQPAQQDADTSAAAAAGKVSRAGSPSSSGLQVKVPEPAARGTAHGEDCVDSATAAAAEAMHLLAGISRSKQQQAAVCADQAAGAAGGGDAGDASGAAAESSDAAAAVAAAAVVAPAAAVPGGKRKRESGSGAGDGTTSGTAASSPLAGQVAEALSAAADLAGAGPATTTQDQQLNGSVLDPAAATAYMPAPAQAAYDQQQLLLQQHEQQQQHSLMQQLLQLQQQQPAWDMAYSNQLGPLDLHQQALQMQLGAAGLGGSGNLAALQQQMQLQAPAAAAAAAASAGQQPAAKRQRLSGVQMAELIASVKHHVQVNPERYTHCVIKDMKEKYPDLELNMGQIRKIKFRTLGNVNCGKQSAKAGVEPSSSAAARGADPAAAAAAGCSGASAGF